MEKIIRFRKLTSLLILSLGIISVLTGIVLYILPWSKFISWNNFTLLGLTKWNFQSIHINSSFLFSFFLCFHVFINAKSIVIYCKSKIVKFKLFIPSIELIITLSLSVFLIIGSILNIPPFSTFIKVGTEIKSSWHGNIPPFENAEQFTIRDFALKQNLNVIDTLVKMKLKGLNFRNENDKFSEIAKLNKISNQKLLEIIQEQ